MFARTVVLSASLLLTAGYLAHASRLEVTPSRISFSRFPIHVGHWSGQRAPEFDPQVLAVLGVDEHVNRYYTSGSQLAHLYVGYYRSQREGSQIHSPMNCLPGGGWQPIAIGRIELPDEAAPGRTVSVNRYVIQKGLDKQVVLYWYQSHGRVVASDYWSKVYLVLDSIRLNRTDAALVRVIAPFDESSPAPEAAAERAAVGFATTIYPLLGSYLPT